MIDGTIEISVTVRHAGNIHNSFAIYELETLTQMYIGQKILGWVAMEKAFDAVKAAGIEIPSWTRDKKNTL